VFATISSPRVLYAFYHKDNAEALKDIKSARLFTNGWLFYYNYLRPHESLDNKTPAKLAGISVPYWNWQDIVSDKRIITPKQTSATSSIVIPRIPEYPNYKRSSRKRIRKHRIRQRREPQLSLAGVRG